MSKQSDSQLADSINNLIRNKTDINSITPADVADALQNIVDSKVNRNSTSQGAHKYYALFDPTSLLDENGEGLPGAIEQLEGRSYIISVDGTADLNGMGPVDYKTGDILTCIFIDGYWQWFVYGNIFGGTSLPTASIGQILVSNGSGWVNDYSVYNAVGNVKSNWNDDYLILADTGDTLLLGSDDGLYLYSNSGGPNRLAIAVRERTLRTIDNYSRARWQNEFEVYFDSAEPVLTAGENGFTVYGVSNNYGIRYYDAMETFDFNGNQIQYERMFSNSGGQYVFDFENGLGYDGAGNYSIDLFSQQLLFEGTQKFSWDGGVNNFNGYTRIMNYSGTEEFFSVDSRMIVVKDKFSVEKIDGTQSYFYVNADTGVITLPMIYEAGSETPDAIGFNNYDNSIHAFNIRERIAFGPFYPMSGNAGTLTPIWPNSTNGSVHLTSNVATTVGADFSAKVFDAFYQSNGSNGGLYTMYLINGNAGTPTVFSFDNTKYKVSGNATVGSLSDSARRLMVILFAWQDGKMREISRTAGTGTLLD